MKGTNDLKNKLDELYKENKDFKDYVDKCANTYKKTPEEILLLETTYQYSLYLKEGLANNKDENK